MNRKIRPPAQIVFRMTERYFTDGVAHAAAELAFFLLFSLFPLLMVLNSLLGMANFSEVALLDATRFLPEDVQNIIIGYLTYLGSTSAIKPLLLGSGLTLYFLSRAVRSIIYSMSRIYQKKARRGAVGNFVVSVILTAGLLLLVAMSILLIVVGKRFLAIVMRWFPMLQSGAIALHYLAYPVGIVIALGFLIVLYSLVPPVRVSWRGALPGAGMSLAGWAVLTRCFAYYVDHMGRYSILYGSIGAIIVLMLWLYLISTILILGGVLNHTLEQRRKGHPVDMTRGCPRG